MFKLNLFYLNLNYKCKFKNPNYSKFNKLKNLYFGIKITYDNA